MSTTTYTKTIGTLAAPGTIIFATPDTNWPSYENGGNLTLRYDTIGTPSAVSLLWSGSDDGVTYTNIGGAQTNIVGNNVIINPSSFVFYRWMKVTLTSMTGGTGVAFTWTTNNSAVP